VQCTHLWVNLKTIESTVAEKAEWTFKLNSEDVQDMLANVRFFTENATCSLPTKNTFMHHVRREKRQLTTVKVFIKCRYFSNSLGQSV